MPFSSSTMRMDAGMIAIPELILTAAAGAFESASAAGNGIRPARETNHEPRSHRQIVLGANRPVVFGNNAAGNRQAKTRSAVLGRKVRQEKSLSLSSGEIPGRCRPHRFPRHRRRLSMRVKRRSCRNVEPSMASAALSMRLASTRRINSGSALTGGSIR